MKLSKQKGEQLQKMKKIITLFALILSLTLSAFMLTACEAGFSAEKNITIVTREPGSGTRSAFMEIIGLKGKTDVANAVVSGSTAGVLQEVKNNPHAIGYDSLGYVTDDVKILKVDGITPTVASIKDGSYAISRPLSIVYKAETIADGAAKAFYEFLTSKTAQDIVASEGYAGLDATSEYVATPSLSGTIKVSGSTSLEPLMKVLADKFESLQPNVNVTVSGGGSGQGLSDAENSVSTFGMISKKFKQEDAPSCTFTSVAYDGIAVIVNKENPLDNITSEQLKNIYDKDAADKQITSWKALINE